MEADGAGMAQRQTAAAIIGVCLLVGLTAAGYLIGRGTARFRTEARTVTVKGLVEKEVKADEATWSLNLRRAGNSPGELLDGISADRDAVIAFLKKQGFQDGEIIRHPTSTTDTMANEYRAADNARGPRFLSRASVVVRTKNVDLVQSSIGSTEELLQAGVILDGNDRSANPRYRISNFNDMRSELLAAATSNARTMAEQFAADSGARVGKIYSANQGSIQIFGSDGGNESEYYSNTSTPDKVIRLVSTFEFELE